MEALEEEAYADLVRPENEVNQSKSPTLLSRKPAMSARRYRLSLSPLDSLQAEFKKYKDTEQMLDLRLAQSTNHQLLVSAFSMNRLYASYPSSTFAG